MGKQSKRDIAIALARKNPAMRKSIETQRELAKTSGMMGMKRGTDFVTNRGQVVSVAEKERALELEKMKEKKRVKV